MHTITYFSFPYTINFKLMKASIIQFKQVSRRHLTVLSNIESTDT